MATAVACTVEQLSSQDPLKATLQTLSVRLHFVTYGDELRGNLLSSGTRCLCLGNNAGSIRGPSACFQRNCFMRLLIILGRFSKTYFARILDVQRRAKKRGLLES